MPNLMDSGSGLKQRVSDGTIRHKVKRTCSVRNIPAEIVYPRSALQNEADSNGIMPIRRQCYSETAERYGRCYV